MEHYGNCKPNNKYVTMPGSIPLGTKQNEVTPLQTNGDEDEEYYSVIDIDDVQSNITKAGKSDAKQSISKTDSSKLGENVVASSSQPTDEQDDRIGKTKNRTIKDNTPPKSNTNATIMIIVGIIAVGVASSAITVIIMVCV